jgi:hypothetical protein
MKMKNADAGLHSSMLQAGSQRLCQEAEEQWHGCRARNVPAAQPHRRPPGGRVAVLATQFDGDTGDSAHRVYDGLQAGRRQGSQGSLAVGNGAENAAQREAEG